MSRLTDMNAYWTDVLSCPELLGLDDLRTAGALLLSTAEQIEVRKAEMCVDSLPTSDCERVTDLLCSANDVHNMASPAQSSPETPPVDMPSALAQCP